MLFHLVAHAVNLSLRNDVAVVQQHYAVRHHVDFVQDVTRNDQVQSFGGKLRNSAIVSARAIGSRPFSGSSRINTAGLVRDRLRQPHRLPHAFAVSRDLAIGSVQQA